MALIVELHEGIMSTLIKFEYEKKLSKSRKVVKILKNYEPFKDSSYFENSTPVSAKQKLSDVETKSFESNKDKFKCVKCEYKCKKNQH